MDFQDGLSNKRRYPVEQFRAFWDAGKRYAELTRNNPLIHRKVVKAINGLREFLEVERKRIPGTIIADADIRRWKLDFIVRVCSCEWRAGSFGCVRDRDRRMGQSFDYVGIQRVRPWRGRPGLYCEV